MEEKKKRGRKRKEIQDIKDKNLIYINSINEETLILILPITLDDINNKEYIICNENEIKPYDDDEDKQNIITDEYDDDNSGYKTYYDKTKIIKIYDILKSFKLNQNNHRNWRIKTDTVCWYDCHAFNSIPISIPISYNSVKNILGNHNSYFKVYGCFCSFNCAKAYLHHGNPLYYNSQSLPLLSFLYKSINKLNSNNTINKFKDIQIAPPRELLTTFGGYLNIEEYREKFNTNTEYNIIKYPMISEITQIEETYTEKSKNIIDNHKTNTKNDNIFSRLKQLKNKQTK